MPDLTGIPALDLLIGLSFIYLLLSLLCSAIQEAIAGIFKLRAKNLEKGLHNMLAGETDGSNIGDDALSKRIWTNPLIQSLFKGDRKPSYIAPRTFALALPDTIDPDAGKPTIGPPAPGKSVPTLTQKPPNDVIAELRQTVDSLPEPAKGAPLPLIDEARGDIDRIRRNIEDWF